MDPLIGSALITGAGSLLGGLGSIFGQQSANENNLQAARETNQMNYRIFQEANAFNRQERLETQDYNRNLWYEQQRFNSPAMQAQRLRLAGINPSTVLGGNAAQSVGSIAASQPASSVGIPSAATPHYDPVFSSEMITGPLNALSDLFMKREQMKGLAIDNEYKAAEHQSEINKRLEEIQSLIDNRKTSQAQREKLYQEKDNLEIELELLQFQRDRQNVVAQQQDETWEQSIQALRDQHETALLTQEAQRLANEIQEKFGLKMAEREYYRLGIACKHALAEIGLIGAQTNLTNKQANTEVERYTEQVLKNIQLRHDSAHYPQIRKLINDELRAKIRQQNASAAFSEFGVSAGGLAIKAAPWLVGGAAGAFKLPKALRYLKLKYGSGKVVGNTISW